MARSTDTALGGKYLVKQRNTDTVLAETITPDEAVHLAGRFSGRKDSWGSIFIATAKHPATGKEVIKGVGMHGRGWFAQVCPKANAGTSDEAWCPTFCNVCGGLGVIPR